MTHEIYMQRCFDLARKSGKETLTNPQVGSVLVYNERIIGEGYHEYFGGPHAEVNCLSSVAEVDRPFIQDASLYVSLEPCCITGKTPPCTDIILKNNIKKVVISTLDVNKKIRGKGLEILKRKGVEVVSGVLEKEGKKLISKFSINHLQKRPYILLKIVKSKDNFIGRHGENIWLSNPATDIYTHKIRSEYDGIMVGSKTALNDNPALTTRNYPGPNACRVLLDRNGIVPKEFKIFNNSARTIYFTSYQRDLPKHIEQIIISKTENLIEKICKSLFDKNINALIIEGGATLIGAFYNNNYWDEAMIITSSVQIKNGIPAPNIEGKLWNQIQVGNNKIQFILPD